MANDLIAALETAAIPCMAFTASTTENSSALDVQIALIRNHIADLRNGGERAKVVAFIERYPTNDYAIGMAMHGLAQAIASGAHMGGDDADRC